jgi:hypothetical protein
MPATQTSHRHHSMTSADPVLIAWKTDVSILAPLRCSTCQRRCVTESYLRAASYASCKVEIVVVSGER